MKQVTILLFLICLSIPLMACHSRAGGNLNVMHIGNGAYTSAPLRNPVNDVTDPTMELSILKKVMNS